MALIACSECGNEVSDKATSCPKCGNPIATAGAGTGVQAIEQTAKRFKAWQLLGGLMTAAGCVTQVAAFGSDPVRPEAALSGGLLFLAGIAVFLGARAAAWWHHG